MITTFATSINYLLLNKFLTSKFFSLTHHLYYLQHYNSLLSIILNLLILYQLSLSSLLIILSFISI